MAPGDRPGELRWVPNEHWAGFAIAESGYRCKAHATDSRNDSQAPT